MIVLSPPCRRRNVSWEDNVAFSSNDAEAKTASHLDGGAGLPQTHPSRARSSLGAVLDGGRLSRAFGGARKAALVLAFSCGAALAAAALHPAQAQTVGGPVPAWTPPPKVQVVRGDGGVDRLVQVLPSDGVLRKGAVSVESIEPGAAAGLDSMAPSMAARTPARPDTEGGREAALLDKIAAEMDPALDPGLVLKLRGAAESLAETGGPLGAKSLAGLSALLESVQNSPAVGGNAKIELSMRRDLIEERLDRSSAAGKSGKGTHIR